MKREAFDISVVRVKDLDYFYNHRYIFSSIIAILQSIFFLSSSYCKLKIGVVIIRTFHAFTFGFRFSPVLFNAGLG